MDVFPDFGGEGGDGQLRAIVGALLMFVLLTAVLMLIVSAIVWTIAAAHGNYRRRPFHNNPWMEVPRPVQRRGALLALHLPWFTKGLDAAWKSWH